MTRSLCASQTHDVLVKDGRVGVRVSVLVVLTVDHRSPLTMMGLNTEPEWRSDRYFALMCGAVQLFSAAGKAPYVGPGLKPLVHLCSERRHAGCRSRLGSSNVMRGNRRAASGPDVMAPRS